MTFVSDHRGVVARIGLVIVCMGAVGCSAFASASRTDDELDRDRTTTTSDRLVSAPAAPTVTQRPRIRDDDITDVAVLAGRMAEGTAGDQEWIEILAELRTRSWLAIRYPGRYELTEIYSEEWAVDHGLELEQELLQLGVYFDEPLPRLLSVTRTRQLGNLVEVEVILEAGQASIRQEIDDVLLSTLPGGTQRGLFTLGQDGSSGRWRIHSVIELQVLDGSEEEELNP